MAEQAMLRGKHAIVTGGSRGIGAAIARELARHGASLTLMGRDQVALAEVSSSIIEQGGVDVQAVECDVAEAESVARAFDFARSAFGEPYILVNNAGQAAGAAFTDTSRELWDQLMSVNVTGTFLCTKQVVPAMVAAGVGRIVNVASVAGLQGYGRISAYAASKHAVIGLTRALGIELARTGVTVNAVCPSYVDTEMTDRTIAAVAARTESSAGDARKRLERMLPIGRLITPEEVAEAVAWLCSPASAAITAQSIVVAGGEVQ